MSDYEILMIVFTVVGFNIAVPKNNYQVPPQSLWTMHQRKYPYASDITNESVIESLNALLKGIATFGD